jgi:hypothetical protein
VASTDDGTQWRWDGSTDGGDDMARGRRKGIGTQGTKPCWWVSNGEATGRAVAGGERADSLITSAGEGADKRGRVGKERERMRGKGRSGSRVGPGWQWRGAGACGRWAELGLGRARGRERGGLGPESAQPGGERKSFFFFFFYFQIYFSFSFSFPLNKYLFRFLWCPNIICEVLLTIMVYAYDE